MGAPGHARGKAVLSCFPWLLCEAEVRGEERAVALIWKEPTPALVAYDNAKYLVLVQDPVVCPKLGPRSNVHFAGRKMELIGLRVSSSKSQIQCNPAVSLVEGDRLGT